MKLNKIRKEAIYSALCTSLMYRLSRGKVYLRDIEYNERLLLELALELKLPCFSGFDSTKQGLIKISNEEAKKILEQPLTWNHDEQTEWDN